MKTKRVKAIYTLPGDVGHDRVIILPADADSYERMVEQINAELHIHDCKNHVASGALRAIGITAPKQKKGTQ